jgi:hypothetical protein
MLADVSTFWVLLAVTVNVTACPVTPLDGVALSVICVLGGGPVSASDPPPPEHPIATPSTAARAQSRTRNLVMTTPSECVTYTPKGAIRKGARMSRPRAVKADASLGVVL